MSKRFGTLLASIPLFIRMTPLMQFQLIIRYEIFPAYCTLVGLQSQMSIHVNFQFANTLAHSLTHFTRSFVDEMLLLVGPVLGENLEPLGTYPTLVCCRFVVCFIPRGQLLTWRVPLALDQLKIEILTRFGHRTRKMVVFLLDADIFSEGTLENRIFRHYVTDVDSVCTSRSRALFHDDQEAPDRLFRSIRRHRSGF
jgi:hypothetical protein